MDDIHHLPTWPLVGLSISLSAPWIFVSIFIWSTP